MNSLSDQKIIYFPESILRSSILVSGSIAENTFWEADTVKVVGDIQVENGIILSIAPGTKVEFQDFYSLNIQGSVQAIGESENLIHFTSERPDLFEIDYTTAGAWNGIKFQNTPYSNEPSILKYCVIEYSKNVAENGVGAAISCFDFSKLKVDNCIFRNNLADFGGAIGIEFNSNLILNGNVFTENYAFIGGSLIYCTYSYPRLINNTIVENHVLNEDIFFGTGAIHTFQAKPQLYNNIIWDNFDYFFEESPLLFCKPFYVEYNDIESGFSGDGNIDLDPEFVNQAGQDFSLLANSCCIDAGLDELAWNNELSEFDLFGNQRIYGSSVDMGAIEWQSSSANDQLPVNYSQMTNHPNPFNPSTTISFDLSTETTENTELVIYNIKGQIVKTLNRHPELIEGSAQFNSNPCPSSYDYAHNDRLKMTGAGRNQYSIVWNGDDDNGKQVSSGIYFAKLRTGNQILTRKMLLIK